MLIFWDKTISLMDIWSIEHVLSWISVWFFVMTSNFKIFEKKLWIDSEKINTKYFDLIWVLFIAYFWETIEHYLETWLAWIHVAYWFQWVEYWANRIIFDPLMLIIWYYIAMKWKKIVRPARFLSFIWLFFHIFIFPNSMYLQHFLWSYF